MTEWIIERLRAMSQLLLEYDQRLARLESGRPTAEKNQKAKRIPPDWQPSEAVLAWHKERQDGVDEAAERDKFIDYWTSRGEPRRDWDAGYRNWLRKAAEISPPRSSVLRGRSGSRTADLVEINRERGDRVADKLASLWGKPPR